MECVIPGCPGEAFTKKHGWCIKHQRRWERHGDPLYLGLNERGKREAWLREAFATDTDECILWPWDETSRYGHCRVADVPSERANVIICTWTHGPRPSSEHQAAHDCGRSRCVNRRHIVWKTPAENQQDRLRDGTDMRGTKHPLAKLDPVKAEEIRARYATGAITQLQLANLYGVSQALISRVVTMKGWDW